MVDMDEADIAALSLDFSILQEELGQALASFEIILLRALHVNISFLLMFNLLLLFLGCRFETERSKHCRDEGESHGVYTALRELLSH